MASSSTVSYCQAAIAIENSLLFQKTLDMRNHLQSILESITNLVLTLDNEGRLVTANRAVEPMMGVSEETMRARPYSEWFGGANLRWQG